MQVSKVFFPLHAELFSPMPQGILDVHGSPVHVGKAPVRFGATHSRAATAEPAKPLLHTALQLWPVTTGTPLGLQVLLSVPSDNASGMWQGIFVHVSDVSEKSPLFWQLMTFGPPAKPATQLAVQLSPATFPAQLLVTPKPLGRPASLHAFLVQVANNPSTRKDASPQHFRMLGALLYPALQSIWHISPALRPSQAVLL